MVIVNRSGVPPGVLYSVRPKIRIKVQRPTAIVALQIVDWARVVAPSSLSVCAMVRLRPERSLKRFSVLIRGTYSGAISAALEEIRSRGDGEAQDEQGR